jgi:NAD(P)-dependent dehydrogenase (short-subunit alcohol dehydrogenase family)
VGDRFAGRRVAVVGAAGGIGAAIATSLHRQGATVYGLDRAGLENLADGVAGFELDLSSERSVVETVERLYADDPRPIDLVNSAGIVENDVAAEDMPTELFDAVMAVNLRGVFLTCREFGRRLLAGGGGAIVNIASMSGTIVNRDLLQVHYNASKAAVIHLSKSLAMEWAPRGIRVNSLSPGYTATPMNTRPEVAERVKRFAADTPLGRMAAPTEMVGPAVFLLSEAASFCTGVDLIVDGGFVCW